MIERRRTVAVIAMLATFAVLPAAGQQVMSLDPENSLMLREIGLVATVEEGEIRVVTMMPAGSHAGHGGKAGSSVKRGDAVLMINGERVRDLGAARAAYDAVAVGGEVKLAVRRDDRPFLVGFVKQAAGEGGPGGRVVMHRMTFGDGEDAGDIQPILGLGIVARGLDGEVSVAAVLPIGETALAEGDVIRRLAGEDVTSVEQLAVLVDAAEAGATLEVIVERGGARQSLELEKQEAKGKVMVRGGS